MPGICASEYALPLLSFNGAGGILYGGLGIFVASTTVDDFNVNLADALVVVVNDDGDGDEEGAMDDDSDVDTDGDGDFGDWLSNGLPVFTGAIDSLPADKKIDKIKKKSNILFSI